MKKYIPQLFLLIVIILSLVNFTNAGDRMMLIEFFTSSTCGPCAANNPTMTAFLNAQDPDRITAIGHHMNWPSPGNDPMYLYNQNDNNSRRGYYGINSIPAGQFDGLISIPIAYSQSNLLATFNTRKDILSPVTIILTDSAFSTDSILVRAKFYCETYLSNPNVTAFISLVENHIHYSSPPGTNGETDFYWVMRKIYPSGSGQPITLLPGQTVTLEQRYRKDPIWQWSEMMPIAYVQDNTTKEILNAAKKTANFTLLTKPGYTSVTQGQASTKTFKVYSPVIASGYTSAVTFTAEVSPANSGITVSFPNGATLSNFSDSVTVQVASTTAVPTGAYKIILTGTNTQTKTHKISFDYLVGKNYVLVKTNTPGLEYKVNNVSYTSPRVFSWDISSSQTLTAVSPQSTGEYRYVFQNWSNGDTNLTQNISVNANTNTYIANFKPQFRLFAMEDPSGLPVIINYPYNYFDSGSVVNVTVTPLQVQYMGQTWYFNHWFGTGNGSYSGTNTVAHVTMLGPVNQFVVFDTVQTIGIQPISSEIPSKYNLYQNYPNPFNPETKIKFDIANSGLVNLKVYDMLGKEVKTLYSGNLNAGKYEFNFNARELASGMYIYKLQAGSYIETKKMLLIK